MALDSGCGLLDRPRLTPPWLTLDDVPGLRRAVAEGSDSDWGMRSAPGACETVAGDTIPMSRDARERLFELIGGRWLIFRRSRPAAVAEALVTAQREGGNLYDVFGRAGIVVCKPSADAVLEGGSYASTRLVQHGPNLAVRKTITRSLAHGEVDADLRLLREAEWLRDLPDAARGLFPAFIEEVDTEDEVGYMSEFAPAYTLGERMFQRSLGPAGAAAVLGSAFEGLRSHVYGSPFVPTARSATEHDYVARILRRRDAIFGAGPGTGAMLTDLMRASSVRVNGRLCAGLDGLERRLDAIRVERHLYFGTPEKAHGDLILDDVVASDEGVRLVDPNGDTSTRLYDVGKVCLSVLSAYEFMKYDRFTIEVRPGAVPDVRLTVADRDVLASFADLATRVQSVLRETGVLEPGGPTLTGTGLLLLNALQNLALPMFHLLRHRAEERAAAFYAIGLLRLEQAVAWADDADQGLERVFDEPPALGL